MNKSQLIDALAARFDGNRKQASQALEAVLDTITINHLAVGESRAVTFTGPVCRNAVRVTADPGKSIGESLENDNSQLVSCS